MPEVRCVVESCEAPLPRSDSGQRKRLGGARAHKHTAPHLPETQKPTNCACNVAVYAALRREASCGTEWRQSHPPVSARSPRNLPWRAPVWPQSVPPGLPDAVRSGRADPARADTRRSAAGFRSCPRRPSATRSAAPCCEPAPARTARVSGTCSDCNWPPPCHRRRHCHCWHGRALGLTTSSCRFGSAPSRSHLSTPAMSPRAAAFRSLSDLPAAVADAARGSAVPTSACAPRYHTSSSSSHWYSEPQGLEEASSRAGPPGSSRNQLFEPAAGGDGGDAEARAGTRTARPRRWPARLRSPSGRCRGARSLAWLSYFSFCEK